MNFWAGLALHEGARNLGTLSDAGRHGRPAPGVANRWGTPKQATAEIIACLAEVDRRRLYLAEACSSLQAFCMQRLGYSENEAQKRIQVARLYQRLPQVLRELENGSIHLTGLFLLSVHLTAGNAEALLAEARGRTRREIEAVVARWFPRSDVLPSITPLQSAVDIGRHSREWYGGLHS